MNVICALFKKFFLLFKGWHESTAAAEEYSSTDLV